MAPRVKGQQPEPEAHREGPGEGAEEICLHEIFGTAGKDAHISGKGVLWFLKHGLKKKRCVCVREISGGDVEQDRAASSAGSLGGGGVLLSPPRPCFKGSLFIGTSCSGPGVRNLSCF